MAIEFVKHIRPFVAPLAARLTACQRAACCSVFACSRVFDVQCVRRTPGTGMEAAAAPVNADAVLRNLSARSLALCQAHPQHRSALQQSAGLFLPDQALPFCCSCKAAFGAFRWRHHCRACGLLFCSDCTSAQMRLPPAFRQGQSPMRVCLCCAAFGAARGSGFGDMEDAGLVSPAIVYRAVIGVIASLDGGGAAGAPAIGIGGGAAAAALRVDLKASGDVCCECLRAFEGKPKLARHHCRRCGQAVCEECSPDMRPLPEAGFAEPVRQCTTCVRDPDRFASAAFRGMCTLTDEVRKLAFQRVLH